MDDARIPDIIQQAALCFQILICGKAAFPSPTVERGYDLRQADHAQAEFRCLRTGILNSIAARFIYKPFCECG